MGRITLFTADDCVYCDRVMSSLNELAIGYTEINLSTHPKRRPDMLALSDRLTVPQVFFNERHVGGADDTFETLEAWGNDPSQVSIQEHYVMEVASQPDPTDPRLQPSTEPPIPVSAPPPRPSTDRIRLPDGVSLSVLSTVERLKEILPRNSNTIKRKTCKNSFSGADAVAAFRAEYNINTPEAIRFAEYLRQSLLLHSVVDRVPDIGFENSEKRLYRLQCYHTPDVLNSYRIWTTVVDPDYMAVLKRLKRALDKVERNAMDPHTKEVNYAAAKRDPGFPIFEEAVCELQRFDLSKLDRNTIMAFGINAYNLFIKYAFIKTGIGSSSRSRSAFFNGVRFRVGPETFSFQDFEHGFLRGNRKAPYSMKAQFGKKDPRLAIAKGIGEPDCRLHFALNCGAKSCPPMKTFTADGLEEELRIVSQAFCEDSDNCEINVKKRTLYLNKILGWYRVDFCASDKELPAKIVEYLRGEKRATLQKLLDEGKPIRVAYKTYDWSSNASDYVPFDSAILRADEQRFGPRFKLGKLLGSSKNKSTSSEDSTVLTVATATDPTEEYSEALLIS